jgi:hypothetical protein
MNFKINICFGKNTVGSAQNGREESRTEDGREEHVVVIQIRDDGDHIKAPAAEVGRCVFCQMLRSNRI